MGEVGGMIVHPDVKHNPIFDGLSLLAVVRLQTIMQKITIEPGNTIVTLGDEGFAMFMIISGTATMESNLGSKTPLGPGDSFGEEVLLGLMDLYTYRITANTLLHMEMVHEDCFLRLFKHMPTTITRMRKNFCDLQPQWRSSLSRKA